NTLKLAGNVPLPAQTFYSVRVRSTDSGLGNLTFDKVFTISINHTPTDIALSDNRIYEGESASTSVGLLTTTDPDAGQSFSYSLVTGTGATDNALFTVVGGTLKLASDVPLPAKASYSIRISTTDSGFNNLTFDKVLTISANHTPSD